MNDNCSSSFYLHACDGILFSQLLGIQFILHNVHLSSYQLTLTLSLMCVSNVISILTMLTCTCTCCPLRTQSLSQCNLLLLVIYNKIYICQIWKCETWGSLGSIILVTLKYINFKAQTCSRLHLSWWRHTATFPVKNVAQQFS